MQRCQPQYRRHFKAVPLLTIAQLRSVPSARSQKAATRPYVSPTLRHERLQPSASPRSSRVAASADAAGHGWPGEQDPSVSRAATPERRTRIARPSASLCWQRKVSPSVTCATVHVNSVCPRSSDNPAAAALPALSSIGLPAVANMPIAKTATNAGTAMRSRRRRARRRYSLSVKRRASGKNYPPAGASVPKLAGQRKQRRPPLLWRPSAGKKAPEARRL